MVFLRKRYTQYELFLSGIKVMGINIFVVKGYCEAPGAVAIVLPFSVHIDCRVASLLAMTQIFFKSSCRLLAIKPEIRT